MHTPITKPLWAKFHRESVGMVKKKKKYRATKVRTKRKEMNK